jgi:hypothetical protein
MASGEQGEPKVKVTPSGDDAKWTVDVSLRAGQRIFAARDPLYFSEGMEHAPTDGGTRWDASADNEISFATDGADVTRLNIAKGPYVLPSRLAAVWTDGVRLEPQEMPGVPGFTRASGTGQLWLLIPGRKVQPPVRLFGGRPSIVVDPERILWARIAANSLSQVTLTATPGPGDRTWLRVGGNPGEMRLFTGPRSAAGLPGGSPGPSPL